MKTECTNCQTLATDTVEIGGDPFRLSPVEVSPDETHPYCRACAEKSARL